MIKKLLLTTILFLLLAAPIFALTPIQVDQFAVTIDSFVDVDNTSTITVTPNTNEISIYSDVVVRILDRNNNPVAAHSVVLYAQGSPAEVTFVQPTVVSNASGYTSGKVRSSLQGAYVIKAIDTSFTQDINITDSDSFFTFPLPIPSLNAEPYYTKGTSNRVYWSNLPGLGIYQYYVECSRSPVFSTIFADSGWVSGASFEFTNLTGNKMFYYRVKAKNIGGAQSGWSNVVFSVQDITPPVVSFVSIDRVFVDEKLSSIAVVFDATDNFEIGSANFTCKREDGTLDTCGHIDNVGTRYYVDIPLSDLEKGSWGVYLDKYTFCAQAFDKAGNSTTNCDFSIEISKYIETPFPIFTNLINSIIKEANRIFGELGDVVNSIIAQSQELLLQVFVLIIFILVILICLSIIAGGMFVIPTFLLSVLLAWLRFFGFKKVGNCLGYVYNAITGKPIKYAQVCIYDSSNKLVIRESTNKKGEFFGEVDTGKYRIIVGRSHFLFPSQLYKEYQIKPGRKLYTSEYIMVSGRNPMNVAIPIDPINLYNNWTRQKIVENRIIRLMKALAFLLLAVGLAFSIIVLEKYPNIINLIFTLLYIPAIGVFLKSVVKLKILNKGLNRIEKTS
ncbi:hypothetical protein M0R04_01535 [Candidatus Dojkabacteria bacterium]|jgi:hypothetical protein|nr:hypothetical protein [Candidatus Dojkabacteria bacterium]